MEYAPGRKIPSPRANPGGPSLNSKHNWANGLSSTSLASMASFSSSSLSSLGGDLRGVGPAFVFVVDACTAEEELRALKNELLLVVEQLPENALVGLITFDSMVRVHDLGFSECSRVVLFHGDRELSSEQVLRFENSTFFALFCVVIETYIQIEMQNVCVGLFVFWGCFIYE